MKKRKKRGVTFIATLIVFFLFLPVFAFAQLGVGPLSLDIEIFPGETGDNYSFEVLYSEQNPDDDPVRVSISLVDWKDALDGTPILYPPETLPRSLAPWIDFSPFSFLLGPGETQKVTVAVNLPPGEKGPHWAMFLVKSDRSVVTNLQIEGDKEVIIRGSMVYGVKVRQIDLASARSEGKIVWAEVVFPEESDTFLKVVADFVDTGTTFSRVGGTIEFRDERGETIDTIQIRPFHILPGAKKRIEHNYKKELPPGEYIALITIDFDGSYLVAAQVNFKI